MNKEVKITFWIGLVFLAVITLFPLTSAAIVQTSEGTNLDITYPKYDVVPANGTFNLNIHVINATKTKTNLTTSCILHLYNPDGYPTTLSDVRYQGDDGDFEVSLIKGNFSALGVHAFYIQCNSSSEVGFVDGVFEVTPTGYTLSSGVAESNTGLLIAFIIGLGIIALIYLLMGSSFSESRPGIKVLLYSTSALIPVLIIYSIYKLSNTTGFNLANNFDKLFLSGAVIVTTIFVIMVFYYLISYLKGMFKANQEASQNKKTDFWNT